MADFVAVIRRAVDGLTDNSPDLRGKVYDKARGAVRRQLEAMNPRPSDELVQRQLDKLEKAITEVESEHAEALPAEEVPIEETVPAAIAAPEVPEPPETVEPPELMNEPGPPEHQMIEEAPAVPQAQSEEPEPPVADPAPAFQPAETEPEAQHWGAQHWTEETASLPQDVAPAQDETAHPDAAVEAEDHGPSFIGLQPVEDPANDHTAFAEQAAASHPDVSVHDEPATSVHDEPAA
ncbi:MAG TPA: hypothetical protein VLZ56_07215, partial [Mycoplana sp.]|nr:hypothetical protein [Mycoplana sp.]